MLSCLRYGDINYFAACFLTVTGRRGNAYAYSSRVYNDISTSASASVRGRDYASNFDSSGRRKGTNFSSIAHRHWDYGFTSPRTGFGVIAPMKRRAPALASTTSFFNNALASASPRRLRHAPVLEYHRGRRARPLPFPRRSQPTPASTRGFGQGLRFFVGFS